MIQLRTTKESELEQIVALEQKPDVHDYVTPHTLDEHQDDFYSDEVTYLTIVYNDMFAGFIILVHHLEEQSIECLRIALGIRGKGVGQEALTLMEGYCKRTYDIKRIWLDVFEFNQRGIHVYTKLGYQQFDTGEYEGNRLLYLEKIL